MACTVKEKFIFFFSSKYLLYKYTLKKAQNYNILSGVLNILNKNVKIKMFYKRTVITKGDKRMTRRPVC